MIIRLQPLPDELDLGYWQRLMQMNGGRSNRYISDFLSEWCESEEGVVNYRSHASMMRTVADITFQEFVMRHTTTPLRRAITSDQPDLAHWLINSHCVLSECGFHALKRGAYFCKNCAAEDQTFHGFSYWRREHQLPGVYWCPKHGDNLYFVGEKVAFSCSPAACGASAIQLEGAWLEHGKENRYIQRAFDICSALIDRAAPLSEQQVSKALVQRASEFGFQLFFYQRNMKPLLSDRVLECFGRAWSAAVFPMLFGKETGEFSHQLDGVFFGTKSSVMDYVLAAAVLFDSADEALNAFISTEAIAIPEWITSGVRDDQAMWAWL